MEIRGLKLLMMQGWVMFGKIIGFVLRMPSSNRGAELTLAEMNFIRL
jgi:hypothetical protein